jgi:predicted nuclease with TOPRIM domain
MTTPWDEIRGKIKSAYNEIDSAYERHVVHAVDKVKERSLLNSAVKASLSAIPIIGPNLRDLYDNIGGGTKSEEDKAKEILEVLEKLERQDKEQFDRLKKELDKLNNFLEKLERQDKEQFDRLKKELDKLFVAILENNSEIISVLEKSFAGLGDRFDNIQTNVSATRQNVDELTNW